MSIERRNKPAVMLCNKGFLPDAMAAASSKGMPGLRIIPEPIASESNVMEQIEAGVDGIFDEIISALTRQLSEEEASPKRDDEKPPRIIFKGDLNEVSRFFYRRGWSDGLPIVPPTEEAVAEMLTGTDLPPDYEVAKIHPRFGKATIEKIAVNAVMAGALPTYMPVLIAMVQAFMDSRYFRGQAVSGGSWAPAMVVNGPVRNDININFGLGLMSPGDIANSTIGRTLQMIIRNIAGIRKGVEDMGNYGNPGRYSLVLAENEEESPWIPLHVQQGLNKEDSAVTVTHPSSQLVTPGGTTGTTDPDEMLKSLCYHIPPPEGMACFLINPTLAKILADDGWQKADIAGFIAEYARAPLYQLPFYWANGVLVPRQSGVFQTLNTGQKSARLTLGRDPMASVSKIASPDNIRIICCGGSYTTIGALLGGPKPVTKKIELPRNWDKLVAKYKNIKPTHVLY